MGTQISLKLSDRMFQMARIQTDVNGYDTLQDYIRELIRRDLFEGEPERMDGLFTYLASEDSLAKKWNKKEEDEAWEHLQGET